MSDSANEDAKIEENKKDSQNPAKEELNKRKAKKHEDQQETRDDGEMPTDTDLDSNVDKWADDGEMPTDSDLESNNLIKESGS